jgi:tRNA pseudouridine(55) synthase
VPLAGPRFLVLDKPPGPTSHDCVDIVRAVVGDRRVGHTGTLDPFASGVLLLGLGPATRLISFLEDDHKVYRCGLRLGRATTTGDTEGETRAEAPVPPLDVAKVRAALEGMCGQRSQTTPLYSAVKVNGRRLYELARAGVEVEAPVRSVRIDAVELIALSGDLIDLRLTCGKGTYARAFGEELAERLGTVGHLEALRREATGGATLAHAVDLPRLAHLVAAEPPPTGADGEVDWRAVLRSPRGVPRLPWLPRAEIDALLSDVLRSPTAVLDGLPTLQLLPAQVERLVRSGVLPGPEVAPLPAAPPDHGRFLACVGDEVIALGEERAGLRRALRVLPGAAPA